jgi:hypothetical protein
MALTPTVLQDAIIRLQNNTFLDFEQRQAEFSAFQMFKDGSNLLLPKSQVERLKQSAAQVEKIAVLNRYQATLHSAYTCNFSPDESTSAFVPVTYVTTGFDVKVTPAVNAGNYISEEDDLDNQMRNGFRTVYENLETSAVAYLETNKSTTNASPLFGGPTAGVVTLTAAQQADTSRNLYASIPAIFQRNNLKGKPQDLANTEALIQQQYITNQGTANGQNLQYQTAGINYYRSNYVTNANGMQETHYLTPMGAVGVYNWLPFEAKAQPKLSPTNGWTVMQDPLFGMDWLVYFKEDCVNGQWTRQWNFTSSFGFMRQYSSVAGTTPILKYQIANPV